MAGRPRSFDTAKALQSAMGVFWRKGYEGASITDVTEAMGITRPSLYAAFGSKKELFQAVVMQYDAQHRIVLEKALEAPRARDVARLVLRGVATLVTETGGNTPLGSLLLQGGLSCSDSDIPAELAGQRGHWEKAIRDRFIQAQADGDLAPDADPVLLARHTMAVLIGMSVLATEGVSKDELLSLAEMAVFPVARATQPDKAWEGHAVAP